jgi:hypothetical protein
VQQPLQRQQQQKQRRQNYGLQLAAVVKFDVVGVVLIEGRLEKSKIFKKQYLYF